MDKGSNFILNRISILCFCLSILLLPPLLAKFESSFLSCRFHEATGLSCPTCGLSRSFAALLHFDLRSAMSYHWMGPFIFFLACAIVIFTSIELVRGRSFGLNLKHRFLRIGLIGLFVLWILYWLGRLIVELVWQ